MIIAFRLFKLVMFWTYISIFWVTALLALYLIALLLNYIYLNTFTDNWYLRHHMEFPRWTLWRNS